MEIYNSECKGPEGKGKDERGTPEAIIVLQKDNLKLVRCPHVEETIYGSDNCLLSSDRARCFFSRYRT